MNLQDSQTEAIFSFAQASAMLPLLRLIVADISMSHRDLTERKLQMHRITRQRENRKSGNRIDGFYLAEVQEILADLKEEEHQLDELIRELESLGVLLESAADGVVAFPALIDERPAFYLWKMGQAVIDSWHLPGETFADRRPLAGRN